MGLVGQQEGGNGVPETVRFFLGFFGLLTSKIVSSFSGGKYVEYMVEYNPVFCVGLEKVGF